MSVDAPIKPGTIRRNAMRQSWTPVALATLNPEAPDEVIELALNRIRATQAARGCGCYLFIDEALRVYVIPEEKPAALEWVKTRFRALVGFYAVRARGREPWLCATHEGLREDALDHLAVNGWGNA